MSNKRKVTEIDLRMEEFRFHNLDLDDYEFRGDGKIVRKDRWENGIRSIVGALGMPASEFEISDVVTKVREVVGVHRSFSDISEFSFTEENIDDDCSYDLELIDGSVLVGAKMIIGGFVWNELTIIKDRIKGVRYGNE